MRWVAGLLLVVAAVLKAVQYVTDPTAALVIPLGRLLVPVQIAIEFGIGLLILSGIFWYALRWLAVALYGLFAGYALYLALTGAESCGCFGPIRVNPWWTFALDVGVVFGLLISVLLDGRWLPRSPELHASTSVLGFPRRLHVIAVIAAIAVILVAVLVRYSEHRAALASVASTVAGDLVILEPETWVGQRLPIADSVDLDLSQGAWVVLLHRHDCPACQDEVPKYEQRAAGGERIALIEVPPFGEGLSGGSAALHGRLKDNREWFVQTPVQLQLQNGIVTATHTHEH